ncbi:MAG: hypothetical protein ABI740_09340 [Alphaproteobacteria bacterium]
MNWLDDLAYFFGGVFLANAIPHFVAGTMGRPFQSPFAKPPGQGLSSSTVNVAWGGLNFAIAYGLLVWVGAFDWKAPDYIGAAALGGLAISLMLARRFGRFNGGNSPTEK